MEGIFTANPTGAEITLKTVFAINRKERSPAEPEIRNPKSAGGRSPFASVDSFQAAHLTAETRRAQRRKPSPASFLCTAIVEIARSLRKFNAEAQRFAEIRREFFFSAFLRVPLRLCVKSCAQIGNPRAELLSGAGSLGFRPSDFLRISDFGLRISGPAGLRCLPLISLPLLNPPPTSPPSQSPPRRGGRPSGVGSSKPDPTA